MTLHPMKIELAESALSPAGEIASMLGEFKGFS